MLKLADVIKTALNEVGCEELPSGCDDISVDHSFIENNVNNGNTEPPVSTCIYTDCVKKINQIVKTDLGTAGTITDGTYPKGTIQYGHYI